MSPKSYEFTFSGKLYVAYHEVATTLQMLDRRINETLTCKRLFSSYNSRKELLYSLCGEKSRMVVDGLLAGSIHEVEVNTINLRKAA